jgi:hypothetical protein
MKKMENTNVENIWNRIVSCAGEEFTQIKGKKFTYKIKGNTLIPSTTDQNLPKSQFKKAQDLMPLKNTSQIQHLRGPSYLYAILTDKRIQ